MQSIIDESKLIRQEKGSELWKRANGRGTLEYAMRFGKTYTGVLIILKFLKHNTANRVLILVPSEFIVNLWKDYVNEYLWMFKDRVELMSADKAINSIIVDTDLIVVDEIHNFVSDKRYELFNKIKYRYILGLTGTYPTDIESRSKLNAIAPIVDKITREEALLNDWITPYKEYNLALDFTDDEKIKYINYTIPIKETLNIFKDSYKRVNDSVNFKWLKNDYEVLNGCFRGMKFIDNYIQSNKFREIVAIAKGWNRDLDMSNEYYRMIEQYFNPIYIEDRVKAFHDMVNKRNNIFSNSKTKEVITLDIIDKFNINKCVIFNESIKLAESISDELNFTYPGKSVCYHSKVQSRAMINPDTGDYFRVKSGVNKGEIKQFGATSLKKEAINGLIEGKYTYLSTVKALDQGFNVEDLSLVITTAGTINSIQHRQRSARVQTIDTTGVKDIGYVINLYFDDFLDFEGNVIRSRDKQKLIERQKYSDNEILWIKNKDEIIL